MFGWKRHSGPGRRPRARRPERPVEALEGRRLLSGASHAAAISRADLLRADLQRYRIDLRDIQAGAHVDPARVAAVHAGLVATSRQVDALGDDAGRRVTTAINAAISGGIPQGPGLGRLKSRTRVLLGAQIDGQRDATAAGLDRTVDGLRLIFQSAGLSPANLQTIERDRQAIVADGGVAPPDPLVSRLRGLQRRLLDVRPGDPKGPSSLPTDLPPAARAAVADASSATREATAAIVARIDAAFAQGAPDDVATAVLRQDLRAIAGRGFDRIGADLNIALDAELDDLAAFAATHHTLRDGLDGSRRRP